MGVYKVKEVVDASTLLHVNMEISKTKVGSQESFTLPLRFRDKSYVSDATTSNILPKTLR